MTTMQGLERVTYGSYNELGQKIGDLIYRSPELRLVTADIDPQYRMLEAYDIFWLSKGVAFPREIDRPFVLGHRLGGSTLNSDRLAEILHNLRKYSPGQHPPDHVVVHKFRRLEWETADHPWQVWFRND